MGNPGNIYMFNHMLRKSPCAAQPPPQGPIPGTSVTSQTLATAGTSQDQNPGTSQLPPQ